MLQFHTTITFNVSLPTEIKIDMQQYILGNLAEKTLYIKSFILVVYDVRDEMKDLLDERKSIVTLRRIESILRMRINVLDLLHNHCTFMYVIT